MSNLQGMIYAIICIITALLYRILEIGRRKRMDIVEYDDDDDSRRRYGRRKGGVDEKQTTIDDDDLPVAIDKLSIHADDRVPLMRLGLIHSIVDCLGE